MIKTLFNFLVLAVLGIGFITLIGSIGSMLYTTPLWLIALYLLTVLENGL